jgi:uncharacterized protein YxjI
MRRETYEHSSFFSIIDDQGEKKYKVLCKNFQLGKCFFLLDASQINLATIRSLIFPFISVYLIRFGLREISVMENHLHKTPAYSILGIDWKFKSGLAPYSFSVFDRSSELIMSQFKEVGRTFSNYEIEICKHEFEIACLCISICVNNLLINDSKIYELT